MTLTIPGSIPRAALVTGAAQRIGQAVALELAASGFDVAIHFHSNPSAAAETSARIEALGRRAVVLRADLAVEPEVAGLLPRAAGALGPVGVLVNNASRFERDEWDDATKADGRCHGLPKTGSLWHIATRYHILVVCGKARWGGEGPCHKVPHSGSL